MITDNVFHFRSKNEGGMSVVPPRSAQYCAAPLPAGGFDTVRIRIPWPFQLPPTEGFIGVDIDGNTGALVEKFMSMRLESWRGGWGYKADRGEDGSHWLVLEGSPAKAGTGQNIFLPETEGLARGIMYGLEPFLLELRELCHIDMGYEALRVEIFKLLLRGHVERIDFTSHFNAGDHESAMRLLASVDANRGGIYYKKGGSIMRWSRVSDTSLRAGTGRRWGAKLYIKQAEIVVKGHCPSLKKFDLYNACFGWVRYEYTIRSEHLTAHEKRVFYWSADRLRDFRLKTLSKIFWPGQPYSAQRRFFRTRHEVDHTPSLLALKLKETKLFMGVSSLQDGDKAAIEVILKSLYSAKRHDYLLHDLFDEPDPNEIFEMRPVDERIYNSWVNGVDVWVDLNPNTARRIRGNILKAKSVDIKTRKSVELPDFGPAPVIRPVVYDRDWKSFLAA